MSHADTSQAKRRHPLLTLTLAAATAAPFALGCGVEADPAAQVEGVRDEIIGGWTITNDTQRFQGLVGTGGGCSGALIAKDWVITARHCISFFSAASNRFSVPAPNGVMEWRNGSALYPLGATDAFLVKLGTTTANWPNVTRQLYTGSPSSLVGKDLICYGQGATGYASPSGLTGGGTWKQVTKRVSHVGPDGTLVVNAVNGREIMAPGDSGGPCFYGSQLVAENWRADAVCADTSTPEKCDASVTRIDAVYVKTVGEFANYIAQSQAGRTTAGWWWNKLENGWAESPYLTNHASSSLLNGYVYLRGAVYGGNSSYLFRLPDGHRPTHNVYVPVNLVNAKKGRLLIQPDGYVYVYSANGDFREAQAHTSLDGVSFAVTNAVHTAVPLQNQWTNSPYGTRPVAAQDDGGIVRLQGAISTASTNTNVQPFILPSSFRPTANIYVTVDMYGGVKGRAFITPSGSVTLYPEYAGTAAQGFTSFEGVFFAKGSSGGTTLEPSNGWTLTQYGTNTIRVKNSRGIVILRGAVSTTGSNPYFLLLPEQFRPAAYVNLQADVCGGGNGRVIVQPDGWVMIQDREQFGNPAKCFTSLEGLQFGI